MTLATAKAHLHVESTDEDTLIAGFLAAAVDSVDGPDGSLARGGLALVTQQWQFATCEWPCAGEPLSLPMKPVQSIDAVTYVDLSGTEQTLDPDTYLEFTGRDPMLVLAPYKVWPFIAHRPDAVRVTFTAGFGDATDEGGCPDLPPRINAAILIMTADLYKNRETSVEGATSYSAATSMTVKSLLASSRVWAP